MVIIFYPSKACAVGRATPAITNQLAEVCRKSCNIKSAMPALYTARSNTVRKLWQGMPCSVQNTGLSADLSTDAVILMAFSVRVKALLRQASSRRAPHRCAEDLPALRGAWLYQCVQCQGD